MADVILKNVYKTYDDGFEAVLDFNLDIHHGEFLVLVGPSGCGKSTTLRMVAGLEQISKGTVQIGNRVVNEVPPKDRDIAMVFQNYALYPHMNVYDNMAFGLKLRKFNRKEIRERVESTAQMLGLTSELTKKPKALSGGQRQRVAMGRAIVREPAVFLFDEPLSNLDAKMRVEMRKEILDLHRRLHATMIYVTHDQVEAMTLGDRICVMNQGRIEQTGTPMEVFDHPASLFVARFIGSPPVNIFNGTLLTRAGGYLFDGGSFQCPLPEEKAPFLKGFENKPVCLGLRPRSFRLARESAGTQSMIEAKTDLVEMLGEEVLLHVQSGDHKFITCLDPHETSALASGSIVHLDPLLNTAHVFDPATGENLTLPRDAAPAEPRS